jgi:AcrR family transcriptional regulator
MTSPHQPPAGPHRPLRSDAAANAERVLAAAIRSGLSEGRHVPLAKIAEEAGVGVGTLYRRYPNRDALLEALQVRAYGILTGLAADALAITTAGTGTGIDAVEQFLVTSYGVRDQLVLPMHGAPWSASPESARGRGRVRELMTAIVRRGHEDGTIRPDVSAWTVVRFGAMLAQPMPTGPEDPNAEEQRRIFLRGISV